jgi:hypothetical protein
MRKLADHLVLWMPLLRHLHVDATVKYAREVIMENVEVLLKEYETLRRESLDSITHRTQIASFGLAAIGALFAGSFVATERVQASGLVLGVVALGVPLVSVLVLRMWLGELERMERAGAYLSWLEHRINSSMNDHVLTWESWLSATGRLVYPYQAVVILFSLIGVGAPIVGVLAVQPSGLGTLLIIPGVLFTLAAGSHAAYRIYRPKLRIPQEKIETWYQGHRRDDRFGPQTRGVERSASTVT